MIPKTPPPPLGRKGFPKSSNDERTCLIMKQKEKRKLWSEKRKRTVKEFDGTNRTETVGIGTKGKTKDKNRNCEWKRKRRQENRQNQTNRQGKEWSRTERPGRSRKYEEGKRNTWANASTLQERARKEGKGKQQEEKARERKGTNKERKGRSSRKTRNYNNVKRTENKTDEKQIRNKAAKWNRQLSKALQSRVGVWLAPWRPLL